MIKKITSLLLILIIVSFSMFSFAATKDELNAEKKDLQNKIDEAEDRIDDIEGEVDGVLDEISKINAEIAEKQDAISNLNHELKTLNSEISTLEAKLKEEQVKYDGQYESLKARMVAQYKMGKVSYLDVLLNSKSLSDFISRYYVIEKVAEYDAKLLDQIEKQKATIENSKKSVESKKNEVSEKQSKLKIEEIALSNRRTNKNKMVSQLNEEQKKLQDEIDANNKALEQKENELRELARQESMSTSGGHVYKGGKLEWPAPDYTRISSPFGYRGSAATGGVGTAYHRGVDLASAKGSRVLAAEAGVVMKTNMSCPHNYASKCGCGGTLGNYIMISHGGGLVTLYGHCTSVDVSVGQSVSRGQQIGTVGSTGNSTGYHLHFATIANGSYVNPMGYFNK